ATSMALLARGCFLTASRKTRKPFRRLSIDFPRIDPEMSSKNRNSVSATARKGRARWKHSRSPADVFFSGGGSASGGGERGLRAMPISFLEGNKKARTDATSLVHARTAGPAQDFNSAMSGIWGGGGATRQAIRRRLAEARK